MTWEGAGQARPPSGLPTHYPSLFMANTLLILGGQTSSAMLTICQYGAEARWSPLRCQVAGLPAGGWSMMQCCCSLITAANSSGDQIQHSRLKPSNGYREVLSTLISPAALSHFLVHATCCTTHSHASLSRQITKRAENPYQTPPLKGIACVLCRADSSLGGALGAVGRSQR
jgi:hypothetical protein